MGKVLVTALCMFATASMSREANAQQPAAKPTQIFVFHTDELWLSLHHFLYVLGRAQNQTPDAKRESVVGAPADANAGLAKLGAREQKLWRDAVSSYANGLSRKDLIFDDSLIAITQALADAGSARSLATSKVDSTTIALLERVAPIYRKIWWPSHHAAIIAWRNSVQGSVSRHGAQVLAFIEKAYGMTWPSNGYPVYLTGYSNWAGAYSTSGNLLVVSGVDTTTRGSIGLEIVFHEAMHQWDDKMLALLREHARVIDKRVPRDLPHAMIFYTAGEAVRRVVPNHTPYGELAGIWNRGLAPFRAPLQKTWQPYLDGSGTRDGALAKLIAEVLGR